MFVNEKVKNICRTYLFWKEEKIWIRLKELTELFSRLNMHSFYIIFSVKYFTLLEVAGISSDLIGPFRRFSNPVEKQISN